MIDLPTAALGQASEVAVPWGRVFGALVICLGLAVGAAFALKYRMGGTLPSMASSKRKLRLVESLRLSHQVDICLVACEERRFLIAASPHGAVVIAGGELPAEVEGGA